MPNVILLDSNFKYCPFHELEVDDAYIFERSTGLQASNQRVETQMNYFNAFNGLGKVIERRTHAVDPKGPKRTIFVRVK